MKTSSSDPIRVDYVPLNEHANVDGQLGLTLAPGKKDPGRGWHRDLDVDLDRLRATLEVDVLVTLMEEHELARFEMAPLRERAASTGMDARWFPIVDVDVPRNEQLQDFDAFITGLVECLQKRQSVVIHCLGGLGRSGTVAACILVQLGVAAAVAIAAVRKARPGAIQTLAQEQWVVRYADMKRRVQP